MKALIEKFEQVFIYLVIAGIYLVSVFHPDVTVNETAITELTILVLAVLAGTRNITDVAVWFALRFDFGDVVAMLIKEYEKRTNSRLPDFIRETLIQIADDYDDNLTAQAQPDATPEPAKTPDNQMNVTITGGADQQNTVTDGQGGKLPDNYSSGYGDIAQG